MGLAKLAASIATKEEMASLLGDLSDENVKLRNAVQWVLGQGKRFSLDFRTELATRAGLDFEIDF